MVKTVWLRLLVAFIMVSAVCLFKLPFSRIPITYETSCDTDSFTISNVLIESGHALKYLLFASHNDILNAVDDDRAPDHGVLVEPQLVHVLVGGEQVVHVLVVQLEEGHLGGEW